MLTFSPRTMAAGLWVFFSLILLSYGATLYLVDSLDANGSDCSGHGTLMKQTVLQYAPADTRFVYYNTFDSKCQDQTFLISAAFYSIARNLSTPAVVSISGGFYAPGLVDLNVVAILDAGVPIYAAAGNDGTADCLWPAEQHGVTAVEAVNSNGTTQKYSNFCAAKDRSQVQWASTCAGTSVATAILAGRRLSNLSGSFLLPGVGDCTSSTLSPQWIYLGPTLGGAAGAILFCLFLYGAYLFYLKEEPNIMECHPRCLHPCP